MRRMGLADDMRTFRDESECGGRGCAEEQDGDDGALHDIYEKFSGRSC